MKKSLVFSALFIIFCMTVYSQENDSILKETNTKTRTKSDDDFKTLFGNNRSQGAYGAFSFGYTEVDNIQAMTFGGKFEWIVSHSLGFGFGGTGFINEYHWDDNLQRDVFLTGGYGGFIIEPILLPKFPVHLSFPVTLGAGGISYITKENQDYHNMIEDSEVFLVAEPSAELEFNITRHFRLAAGASYRFTTPFDIGMSGATPVSSDAIESWTYTLTFKFGRF